MDKLNANKPNSNNGTADATTAAAPGTQSSLDSSNKPLSPTNQDVICVFTLVFDFAFDFW